MCVHGEPDTDEFPVNGKLYINTSDIPASRKITGLRGIKSEDFMCTFCYQPFSSLVSEDCFNRDSVSSSRVQIAVPVCLTKFFSEFTMHDDHRFVKYAHRWKEADTDERDRIESSRGVSWSTFAALPGWMPAWDSPIDFMHGVFLGKHYSHCKNTC